MAAVGDVLRAAEEEGPERQAELAAEADAAVSELTPAPAVEPRPRTRRARSSPSC